MLNLKQFLIEPNLSATSKTIFAILCGSALTPEEAGNGVLAEYLKTHGEGNEAARKALAGELTRFMQEDITEIERAAQELEAYWEKTPFAQ